VGLVARVCGSWISRDLEGYRKDYQVGVNQCKVLEWDSASIEPAPMDRKEPGEVDWFEGDIDEDVDCTGQGIVITTATAAIRSADDDGLLTLGNPVFTLNLYRVPYTVDADTTQRMYTILVTVTTSDARTLKRWHSLPVIATQPTYA